MNRSISAISSALPLLCLLGGLAHGQGYWGTSGHLVWDPASVSRGIPKMGSLRFEVGYRPLPWLEIGVGTGLVLAKQRGAPPGGVAPRQQLFLLENPEVGISKSGAVESPGSGSSTDLGGTEGASDSLDSVTQIAPSTGAQVMATSRLMLPRLSRYVCPFLELDGGINIVDSQVEATGSWAPGLQLHPTKHLALSMSLGYRIAYQPNWGTGHMLLLAMGLKNYF